MPGQWLLFHAHFQSDLLLSQYSSPGPQRQSPGLQVRGRYQCSYTKTITATVTLNTTSPDFTADVGGVKTALINDVATAAGVSPSKVSVIGAAPKTGARRLLSISGNPLTSDGIVVRANVHGATHLLQLDFHLGKYREGLQVGQNHVVSVVPE